MKNNRTRTAKRNTYLRGIIIAFLMLICLIPSMLAVVTHAESGTSYKASVPMQMYHPDLDTGFTLTNKVTNTVYGSSAYTSLSVQSEGGSITTASYNGVSAYGISGTGVSIKLKINHKAGVGEYLNGSSQWMLCADSWGKYEGEKVNGVTTGQVDSGAVIVQTSYDGKTWSSENKAKYTNGLYTTAYYGSYGTKETTVYKPDGADVSRGVYVRVLYAYEIYDYVSCSHNYKDWHGPFYYTTEKKHSNDNVYHNYVEAYTFYLCNNNPGAVTFHNLSATDKYPDEMKDSDGNVSECYTQAETLLDGAGTVSGFQVYNKLNTAATVEVSRNGKKVNLPSNNTFRESGKYDIKVTTPLGNTKKTTVYVDTSTNAQSLATYFGDGILSGGKRIFSEGSLPVYEGGKTSYSIKKVSEYILPLSGTVRNVTTGTVTNIGATRVAKNGVLTEPGEYEIRLTTNPSFATDRASGDARVFTFRFKIIAEGTAPGPVRNQQNLIDYAASTLSDLYPFYYALTYPSAKTGYITLAFADYKSAVEYAYNYEKGVVEKQSDGSYVYKGILSINGRKQEYNNTWDLTDAAYHFATQAVTVEYFDMSAEHTYLTLDKKVLESTQNLRALELDRSVVVFVNEEQRDALATTDTLPVIYPKKHAYLTLSGETKVEYLDFEFIKDKGGYESHSVKIIDCEGNVFDIAYNKGVGQQLIDMGCKSGLITIVENTVFGDCSTYQAMFVEEGVNAAKVTLEYKLDGEIKKVSLAQTDDGAYFEANIFSLKAISDILDPYSIVKIVKDGVTHEQQVLCTKDVLDLTFGAVGVYDFECVSRLGFSFGFTVEIKTPAEINIDFEGVGADHLESITTHYQGGEITLPTLSRYGYTLIGYSDKSGKVYNTTITEILFKADTVLSPVWEANRYKVSFDSNVAPIEVRFGEEYVLPTPDVDKGYTFISWLMNDSELVGNRLSVLSEGDVQLVARVEKTHAVISFDSQGGSDVDPVVCAVGQTVKLPKPTMRGHRFTGWLYNGELITKISVDSLDDMTLTATWKRSYAPIIIAGAVLITAIGCGAFFLGKAITRKER